MFLSSPASIEALKASNNGGNSKANSSSAKLVVEAIAAKDATMLVCLEDAGKLDTCRSGTSIVSSS
jgi:hypothetical protein